MAGALLALLTLGFDAPMSYDSEVELRGRLEGSWRSVAIGTGDGVRTIKEKDIQQLTFENGKFTWEFSNASCSGTYTADTEQSLCRLDLHVAVLPKHENPIKVIYQIDGDTLRIATRYTNKRLDSFRQEGVEVHIMKRVKE